MIEIRPFAETDRVALRSLFARAGSGAPTESLWGHVESEAAVYLDPYLEHEPESVFLADDAGSLVGYLVGSLGGSALPSEDARMEAAIKKYRLIFRPRCAAFFVRSLVDLAGAAMRRVPTAGEFEDARWPAHLHINVAPEARGTGAADGLIKRWFDHLGAGGSPGCHLQTLVENTRAVRFFERMGFVPLESTPPVPGLRFNGRRVHQQTMVWSVPDWPG